MNIHLAYGKNGLELELPDEWDITVIEPRFVPGLQAPQEALRAALQSPIDSPPLAQRVRASDRVGIVFSDLTRPSPSHLLLPAVLAELRHVPRQNITLFNALGSHRANTPDELRGMLGEEIVASYRIVQSDAFDDSCQVYVGATSFGHQVWLNGEFMQCQVKILTGFIEPHLFAGFSGGPKAVLPGVAAQRTILENHSPDMIAHPKATWGVTHGNPIWEEMGEAARMTGEPFLLNVALNKRKEITGVFAGELDSAHAAGCAFVKEVSMVPVEQPFDIVITTNSGYPLDLNLYQSLKGVSAASLVARPGGAIITAAECWDGVPEHGQYSAMLRQVSSPQALLEMIMAPGYLGQDSWQAQIQAQVQCQAEVYVYAGGLSDEQIRGALYGPTRDIRHTAAELRQRFGDEARLCVLPEGPQTIPYVQTTGYGNSV